MCSLQRWCLLQRRSWVSTNSHRASRQVVQQHALHGGQQASRVLQNTRPSSRCAQLDAPRGKSAGRRRSLLQFTSLLGRTAAVWPGRAVSAVSNDPSSPRHACCPQSCNSSSSSVSSCPGRPVAWPLAPATVPQLCSDGPAYGWHTAYLWHAIRLIKGGLNHEMCGAPIKRTASANSTSTWNNGEWLAMLQHAEGCCAGT